MKMTNIFVTIGFTIVLLLPSANTFAVERKIYVGGSVKYINIKNIDDPSFGFKLLGGYSIHDNLSIEFSYNNFGKSDDTNPLSGSSVEIDGLSGFIAGILPISNLEIIGKIGFLAWFGEEVNIDNDLHSTATVGSLKLASGIGASYNISKHLSIRGEQEFYFLGNNDLNVTSLGFQYSF